MKTVFLFAVLCVARVSASEISLDLLTHWPGKRLVYSGPRTLHGWNQYDEPAHDWRLSAHALRTTSPHWIGLEVPMHGANLISFDLRWQQPLQFAVTVFLNNYRTDRKNTYFNLFLWGEHIWTEIHRNDDGKGETLGEATSSLLVSRSVSHVDFFADRPHRVFALWIDRKFAFRWRTDDRTVVGEGFSFQPVGDGQDILISRIRVTRLLNFTLPSLTNTPNQSGSVLTGGGMAGGVGYDEVQRP